MAASRSLRDLQSQQGNKICVDCSQKNLQWASVSYGVFMCLECSGNHRGLGVHMSFVKSVTNSNIFQKFNTDPSDLGAGAFI